MYKRMWQCLHLPFPSKKPIYQNRSFQFLKLENLFPMNRRLIFISTWRNRCLTSSSTIGDQGVGSMVMWNPNWMVSNHPWTVYFRIWLSDKNLLKTNTGDALSNVLFILYARHIFYISELFRHTQFSIIIDCFRDRMTNPTTPLTTRLRGFVVK